MNENKLTNQKRNKSSQMKSTQILDAIIIGFLFGIIIYSVVNKSKTKKGDDL